MTFRDDLICAFNANKEATTKRIQQHVMDAASRGKNFAIFYDRKPFDFNDISNWCDSADLNHFDSQDLLAKPIKVVYGWTDVSQDDFNILDML